MPTRLREKPSLRDPQCGNLVDPRRATQMTWEGRTYFFCSESCRRRYNVRIPGDADV
jgi:YHS domain-containing protein